MLIRPDRDDAEYRELASRYTASIALTAPASEAVLVAPRWLLVPASRAPAANKPLEIAGRTQVVVRVVPHPDARPRTPTDLALVQLGSDVEGIKPVPLHRRDDEAGKAVVFVAHGPTGIIGQPARKDDGQGRGAINTIARHTAVRMSLAIKPLDDASDLQGQAVPGEEGAAAYIEDDTGLHVAGIYYGDEGTENLFSRLSAFAGWVDSVVRAPAKP